MAGLLAEVDLEHVLQRVADQRQEVLGGGRDPLRRLVLVVDVGDERLADHAPVGRRELRHRQPEQPSDLEDALVGDAGGADRRQPLRRLDVALGVDGSRRRQAPSRALATAARGTPRSIPAALGDLGGRQSLPVSREDEVDRDQREAAVGDRAAELVEGDAALVEVGEQLQPAVALLALEPVEQALVLEVDVVAHPAPSLCLLPRLAAMAEEAVEIPIFELPLVLLPGELVPLHIFEERYKAMIGHCLDSGEPFGIVFRDPDAGARRVGCEARITEVTERFDDGRLNIVVTGERPFRVLDRHEADLYPAGEVEPLSNPPAQTDSGREAAARARSGFAELVERVGGERPTTPSSKRSTPTGSRPRSNCPPTPSSTCSSCAPNRSE